MTDLVVALHGSGQDSAVVLSDRTGRILYALSEERFSNVKHDGVFPVVALAHLKRAVEEQSLGTVRYVVTIGSLDVTGPDLRAYFPDSEFFFLPHLYCHAASAFYASGFNHAAVLVMDDKGQEGSVALYKGGASGLHPIVVTKTPHNLGFLYEVFTNFLGFCGFHDSYKVMGMAAYGQPRFLSLFQQMGQVDADGRLTLNFGSLLVRDKEGQSAELFELSKAFQMTLGGKRKEDEPLSEIHFDIACSLQLFVEELGLALAKRLKTYLPDCESLCLAGGVALNGLMNQRLLKEAGFKEIYIQPASTDDGLPIGAALSIVAEKYGPLIFKRIPNMFLGLDRTAKEAKAEVDRLGLQYDCPKDMAKEVAGLLSKGCVVARYTGRSEFGPRALGNRSILASPLHAKMKDIINARIKHREPFRPFAPACLAQDVPSYFDANESAEYMLLIAQVKADKKNLIPAVVHADGTARVQSVKRESNHGLYDIITAFKKITGVPIVINTSFNVNGEAIVETPRDAIECFLYTDIDYLLIEDMLISKKENEDKRITETTELFLSRRRSRYASMKDEKPIKETKYDFAHSAY